MEIVLGVDSDSPQVAVRIAACVPCRHDEHIDAAAAALAGWQYIESQRGSHPYHNHSGHRSHLDRITLMGPLTDDEDEDGVGRPLQRDGHDWDHRCHGINPWGDI